MVKRSLEQTNPYLSNPERRTKCLIQTVVTSTVIEGVSAADARAGTSGIIIIPKPSRKIAKSGKARHQKSAA